MAPCSADDGKKLSDEALTIVQQIHDGGGGGGTLVDMILKLVMRIVHDEILNMLTASVR